MSTETAPAVEVVETSQAHELGGDPSRSAVAGGRTTATVLILVTIALHSTLVWVAPDTDPARGFSRDLSLSIDGYWYLAEARASVQGHEAYVDPHYRKPLVTIPAAGAYQLFGVGLESSRVLSFLASLGALALVGFLARERWGTRPALWAMFALAVHPAWLTFVRSPVIYPWVACWMLLIVLCATRRSVWAWGASVVLLSVGTLGLKSLVFLAAPPVLLEGWLRLGRTSWARWRWPAVAVLGVAGLAVAGPWARPVFWGQIQNYTGWNDGAFFSQWLGFEERSRLFSALPVVLPCALVGWFFFVTRATATGGARRVERALHALAWSSLPLFAVSSYTPLRYLIVFLPAFVALAVGGCLAAASVKRSRVVRPLRSLAGGVAISLSCAAILYAVAQSISSWWSSPLAFTVASSICGAAVLASCWLGSLRRESLGLALTAAGILFLTPVVGRNVDAAEQGTRSLAHANEQLSYLVGKDATLAGPFAHALTMENGLRARQMSSVRWGDGKLRDTMEAYGCSHLLIDDDAHEAIRAAFEQDGVPLEVIARFYVREQGVHLYRVSTSSLARSPFESAIACVKDDPKRAEELFGKVILAHPKCALAWFHKGWLREQARDPQAAYRCYEEALAHDPGRVEAYVALANLEYQARRPEAALERLEQACRVAPKVDYLREKLDQLRQILASHPSQ